MICFVFWFAFFSPKIFFLCAEGGEAYQSEFEQVPSFWPYARKETVKENSGDDT